MKQVFYYIFVIIGTFLMIFSIIELFLGNFWMVAGGLIGTIIFILVAQSLRAKDEKVDIVNIVDEEEKI